MKSVNYQNLTPGTEIKVVTAWGENETMNEIDSHFLTTKIFEIYFEPQGENCFLRIFAKDADGDIRRVHYLVQDGEIVTADVMVKTAALKAAAQPATAICLHDRASEVVEAMTRGLKSDLELFPAWDRDEFFVKNRTNNSEYEVKLSNRDGKAFGQCSCPDFRFKQRVCKHLTFVLQEVALKAVGATV